MIERYLVPVYMPKTLYTGLRDVKRIFIPGSPEPVPEPNPLPKGALDLSGDREVEWSYVASRLPSGNCKVLDFGSGHGHLTVHAIQKGHRVLALDLEQNPFLWSHPNLERICGDLLTLDLPEHSFDYVLNCSTIEHVGLTGRYGVAVEESNGDLVAMQKLRTLLKPAGKMIMTIPCGQDAVITPWHRVYGEKRLPALLQGYRIEEQCYWVKQADNRWNPADRELALSFVPTGHPTIGARCLYALGCFVLNCS